MDVVQGLMQRTAAAKEAKEKAEKAIADWLAIPFYKKKEAHVAYLIMLQVQEDYRKVRAAVYKGA